MLEEKKKKGEIPLVVDLGKGGTSLRGRERESVCVYVNNLICVFVFVKN